MKRTISSELTKKDISALSTYEFPTPTKVKNKQTNKQLVATLDKSMGWDMFVDVTTSDKCKMRLSKRQIKKLYSEYELVLSVDTMDSENFYLTLYSEDTSFDNPILIRQTKYMTKKELRFLVKSFKE